MNNHPGALHGRVPDAGIPQPVPGVGGPNAAVQWQPVQAPRVARDPVARRKPKQPKLWIIFGGIGVFLLSVPDIATFLINLRPGDHTDNGDGLYWVSGILLIVTVLPGLLSVFFAFVAGIVQWILWLRAGHRQGQVRARMVLLPPAALVAEAAALWWWWQTRSS